MSTTKIIQILPPHKLQEEIEDSEFRFRVISCGRRWGKTLMAMREAFNMLVRKFQQTRQKARVWVVAPTFPLVREDWLIAESLLKDAITNRKQSEMKMDFAPFGFIEFKSAEREDEGLRGAGLDGLVVDEASRVSQKSWELGLRPALADKLGRALFISTPKGRNWFYDIYRQGLNGSKQFKSWQYPTYTNPFFPKEEWEILEKSTPEMTLKQEYLAEFLENEGLVFKYLDRCYRGKLEQPIKGERYTLGVDLAKLVDFLVITVMRNSTRQIVDVYQEKNLDWSVQKKLIKDVAKRFNDADVYVDSTGLGDPIEEDLRKSGVRTRDFKFTSTSKEDLVEQLVLAIEQGLIGIPLFSQTEFLINELKDFGYEIGLTGKKRYGAPSGKHDDGVISLGLAVWGIRHLLYQVRQAEPEERPPGYTFKEYVDMHEKTKDFFNKNHRFRGLMNAQQVMNIFYS